MTLGPWLAVLLAPAAAAETPRVLLLLGEGSPAADAQVEQTLSGYLGGLVTVERVPQLPDQSSARRAQAKALALSRSLPLALSWAWAEGDRNVGLVEVTLERTDSVGALPLFFTEVVEPPDPAKLRRLGLRARSLVGAALASLEAPPAPLAVTQTAPSSEPPPPAAGFHLAVGVGARLPALTPEAIPSLELRAGAHVRRFLLVAVARGELPVAVTAGTWRGTAVRWEATLGVGLRLWEQGRFSLTGGLQLGAVLARVEARFAPSAPLDSTWLGSPLARLELGAAFALAPGWSLELLAFSSISVFSLQAVTLDTLVAWENPRFQAGGALLLGYNF